MLCLARPLLLLSGFGGAAARLAIGIAYWVIKERGDLKRGGSWRDGLVDAGFVMYGALYGPWWWPLGVFALVAVGLTIRGLK